MLRFKLNTAFQAIDIAAKNLVAGLFFFPWLQSSSWRLPVLDKLDAVYVLRSNGVSLSASFCELFKSKLTQLKWFNCFQLGKCSSRNRWDSGCTDNLNLTNDVILSSSRTLFLSKKTRDRTKCGPLARAGKNMGHFGICRRRCSRASEPQDFWVKWHTEQHKLGTEYWHRPDVYTWIVKNLSAGKCEKDKPVCGLISRAGDAGAVNRLVDQWNSFPGTDFLLLLWIWSSFAIPVETRQ